MTNNSILQCRQLAATQDTCDVCIKSAAVVIALFPCIYMHYSLSFKAWDHLVIIWSWDVPQFTSCTINFQHNLWVPSTILIKGIQSQYNEVVIRVIYVTWFHVMKNKPVNCINDLCEFTQQNLINIAFPRLKVALRTAYLYRLALRYQAFELWTGRVIIFDSTCDLSFFNSVPSHDLPCCQSCKYSKNNRSLRLHFLGPKNLWRLVFSR